MASPTRTTCHIDCRLCNARWNTGSRPPFRRFGESVLDLAQSMVCGCQWNATGTADNIVRVLADRLSSAKSASSEILLCASCSANRTDEWPDFLPFRTRLYHMSASDYTRKDRRHCSVWIVVLL